MADTAHDTHDTPGHAPDGSSEQGAPGSAAARAIALIDLTDLADDHAPDGIDELCARARAARVAAVCVWPEYVARCRALLDAPPVSGVGVATVVNFPSGAEPVETVVHAAAQAVGDGADDIDVVLPYRRLLAGAPVDAAAMVGAVRVAATEAARPLSRDVHVKVILETGELPDTETIEVATQLAIDAGADFVKTSTGKTAVGATLDAVRTMLGVVRTADRVVGIKPSGGIRTAADAAAYLALADEIMGPQWATAATFRFGASSLLDALEAELRG